MDQVIADKSRVSKSDTSSRMEPKSKSKNRKKSKKEAKDKSSLRKKHSKKKSRKRHASSSSESSDSSSSSSSSSSSDSSEDEKVKKRKKKSKKNKAKKLKAMKLEASKNKVATEKLPTVSVPVLVKLAPELDVGPHIDLKSSKIRAPMTKEEYEKQQSTLKWITDPETGRRRLIRGSGEIMEEIVSKERHQAINKQATAADGNFFQTQSLMKARSTYD